MPTVFAHAQGEPGNKASLLKHLNNFMFMVIDIALGYLRIPRIYTRSISKTHISLRVFYKQAGYLCNSFFDLSQLLLMLREQRCSGQ